MECTKTLNSLEASKASQEETQERYQQGQLCIVELEDEVQKLRGSLEDSKMTAVEDFKNSQAYQDALVEQSGENYASGYSDAKKDIGAAYLDLDLSCFPFEDEEGSPTHSTAGH